MNCMDCKESTSRDDLFYYCKRQNRTFYRKHKCDYEDCQHKSLIKKKLDKWETGKFWILKE